MMLLLLLVIAQVTSERIHVVTPENEHAGVVKEVSGDAKVTQDENDTYLKAYRELHNTAERRNPLGSYAENPYNTLTHSSYVEDDVYPEFSYKPHSHKHNHYHPQHSVMYGPPSPVSYYHHHHEETPSHHTIIGFPVHSSFHFLPSFLAKFGLQKIFKLIAKIAVLKIILKFVAIIALFFVFPTLLPREKDKGETEDDRLLDNLNDITDWVWNGIEGKKKMDEDDGDDNDENDDNGDDDDDGEDDGDDNGDDNDDEKEEEEQEENNLSNSDKDKNKNKHKHKHEEELDGTSLKLINKVIKEWKEENFGGPDKGSAVSFLLHCVNVVNRVLGVMLGFLKMKHKNMDVMDSMILDRFSIYMKDLMKLWPKIKAGLTG